MEVGASVMWIILRAQVECRIHPDIENGWTKLDCTDAQIMAVQEKAPSTRYTTLWQDPRCSLCRDAPEIIQHITEGCKTLAGRAHSTWSIIAK